MGIFRACLCCLILCSGVNARVISDQSTQCLVGIADGWDSSRVSLALYQKKNGTWRQVGESWAGRLGKAGLAWGLGLHPVPAGAESKMEGDWKSPAGVFALGGVWGYERSIKRHRKLPYTRITSRHLWVEDPESPHYNRQVVLRHEPRTDWEKKAQMRQNDPAHALKLFIAHNAPPKVVKGGGSSIFFHIWRDQGGRPTAGCTVMSEARLRWLIARIDPTRRPVYVLLPKKEYDARRKEWGLP